MTLRFDNPDEWHPFEGYKHTNENQEIVQVIVTPTFVQVMDKYGTVDEFRFNPPRQRTLFNVPDGEHDVAPGEKPCHKS
jgi:hypothetical protein